MEDDLKTCPDCAENVKSAAKVCRFCGHDFSILEKKNLKLQKKQDELERKRAFQGKLRKNWDINFYDYFNITNEDEIFAYNVHGHRFEKYLDMKQNKTYYLDDYYRLGDNFFFYIRAGDSLDLELSKEQDAWWNEVQAEWSLEADLEKVAQLGFRIDPASFFGDEKQQQRVLMLYPHTIKVLPERFSQMWDERWKIGKIRMREMDKIKKLNRSISAHGFFGSSL